MGYINLKVDDELYTWMREAAKRKRVSMSAYVRTLLVAQMERDPSEKAKILQAAKPKKPERVEVPFDELPVEMKFKQMVRIHPDGSKDLWMENPYTGVVLTNEEYDSLYRSPQPDSQASPSPHSQSATPDRGAPTPMPRDPKGRKYFRRLDQWQERVERDVAPLSRADADKLLSLIHSTKVNLRASGEDREGAEWQCEGDYYPNLIDAAIRRLTGAEED